MDLGQQQQRQARRRHHHQSKRSYPGARHHLDQVACGQQHTAARRGDGTLWAWGENASGQMGDNSSTDRMSPVQVGTDSTWAQVACADDSLWPCELMERSGPGAAMPAGGWAMEPPRPAASPFNSDGHKLGPPRLRQLPYPGFAERRHPLGLGQQLRRTTPRWLQHCPQCSSADR